MASAEKLLHEAQFAFNSITYGESSANRRNTRRALKLCNKIIRKYPGTMEAGEAIALMQRLGEVAYQSNIKLAHQHISQAEHHRPGKQRSKRRRPQPNPQSTIVEVQEVTDLDWGGLVGLLVTLPKAVLAVIAFIGFFLFGLLGPFLFVPIVLFLLLAGPLKRMLGPAQREEMDNVIARINAFIAEQRNS